MGRLTRARTSLVLGVTLAVSPIGLGVPGAGAVAAEAPWPLGTISPASAISCPEGGYTCVGFKVSGCTDVTTATTGSLALLEPQGAPRGLVMLFTGAKGSTWWTQEGRDGTKAFAADLSADGFMIVQVRWDRGWLLAATGNDAGTAHLGCRPATVIDHVHRTYFQNLGVTVDDAGQCGFCLTGNSGGASQISYALSHYGLEAVVNAVIPTGGPPHSALDKSCLVNPGEEAYWFKDSQRVLLDRGFGYRTEGPCYTHDGTFVARWREESIATGGSDYQHPATRFHFIYGGRDVAMQTIASDYVDRLMAEGTVHLTEQVVPAVSHSVHTFPAGRDAIRAAILATAG